jgi:hypothetical protein
MQTCFSAGLVRENETQEADFFQHSIAWVFLGLQISTGVADLCRRVTQTGTASFFIHATEALHGDLGGVKPGESLYHVTFQ